MRVTVFPFTSAGPQISAVLKKSDHKLTVTKLKCIWNKYTNYEKWKQLVVLEY